MNQLDSSKRDLLFLVVLVLDWFLSLVLWFVNYQTQGQLWGELAIDLGRFLGHILPAGDLPFLGSLTQAADLLILVLLGLGLNAFTLLTWFLVKMTV